MMVETTSRNGGISLVGNITVVQSTALISFGYAIVASAVLSKANDSLSSVGQALARTRARYVRRAQLNAADYPVADWS